MADAKTTFIGADNLSASTVEQQRALYLKLYAGEVITSFERHTVMLDKHKVRTIKGGKSAQFPVIGRIPEAEYHEPGDEILGQDVPQSEKTLNIDKLLISHIFLGDIDEAISHFEVRGDYSRMQGMKLAQTFDRHVMLETIKNAQTAGVITAGGAKYNVTNMGPGVPAGTEKHLDSLGGGMKYLDANFDNEDDTLFLTAWLGFFRDAKTNFENKFVVGPQYCVIKPEVYNRLATLKTTDGFSLLSRDLGVTTGNLSEATLPPIAGFNIISSPMLPTLNYAGTTAFPPDKYPYHRIDARKVRALIWTPDAVGTVKLMDISLQSQWDIRRQGTLMVARYAMGHGGLRPESSAVAKTSDPA